MKYLIPLILVLQACFHPRAAGPNLDVATQGGGRYWADIAVRDGWRVQEHTGTGHYRLLNPEDVRRAWGGKDHCLAELDRRVTERPPRPFEHVVFLLPGLIRSRHCMGHYKETLERLGYSVIDVNFASTQEDQSAMAYRLAEILSRHRGSAKLSFVTHSMGGIILRRLLDPEEAQRHQHPAWRDRHQLHRAVMIFPPNQGAYLATQWHEHAWFRALYGPGGRQLRTDEIQQIPAPSIPFAIIAGGRGDDQGYSNLIPGDDDGVVAVASTHLDGAVWHKTFAVKHCLGKNDHRVIQAAVAFIGAADLPQDSATARTTSNL